MVQSSRGLTEVVHVQFPHRPVGILGTVKKGDWPEGYQLATAMNFRFPQCVPTHLKTLIPNASNEAITLMRDMLQWDPKKRPTAVQALRYPYFQVGQLLGPSQEVKKVQARPQAPNQHQESKVDLQKSSSESKTPPPVNNKSQNQQPPQPIQQTDNTTRLNQAKAGSLGSENGVGGMLKNGRRRWGQTVAKTSDSWESDVSETAASISKKPSLIHSEEEKSKHLSQVKDQKPLYSFSSVTKLPSNVKVSLTDPNLPGSAARQHYLSQSRYLPGLIGKSQSGDKELGVRALRDLWRTHQTL
ncbi:hypothetical protein WMY93_029745 [Mugilogobius chulae]|uniref:Serine/threonine-protein kinase MAK n=1 Tax=Mugilogobius chulae TaxID=88201 RepID=A0AAW0MS44_9GOBI